MKAGFYFLIFIFMMQHSLFALEGESKTYSAGPLSFEAPAGYLKVEEIGPEAYNISLLEKDPKAKNAWITIVILSKEQMKQFPAGTSLAYFKTTYLGTSKPAPKRNVREIFKKKVWGDWQESKIPTPLMLEAYEIVLSNGSTLFIGFRRLENFSFEKAEKFFNLISMTLKDNSKK